MAKPIIAIVGRPNVGKSTLFNKLIGERRAIIEDTPGVTRDRIYGEGEWCGKSFVVIDTGGIEPKTNDIILKQMRLQAEIAIDTADVIIFMCDVRAGLVADDREIAVMLKKSGKPVVVAVNKADSVGAVPFEFYEFYELPSPFPPRTAAARATCWTPCLPSCPPTRELPRRTTASRSPSSASRMRANPHSSTNCSVRSG